MAREACKKGLSFVAVRDHVSMVHGRDVFDRILAGLSPEDAQTAEGALAIGWYPLDQYARLLRAVDRATGTGDLSTLPAITRFEAERDIPRVHRLLLRLVDPTYVVEKMASLWPRYHSTGQLVIDRRAPGSVDVSLVDWGVDDALCVGFQAYCQRALELAGAARLVVSHPSCRARGRSACLFSARWSRAAVAA